jgi:hypothetical protein
MPVVLSAISQELPASIKTVADGSAEIAGATAIAMDCVRLSNCPFYNDRMPMEQGIGSILKKSIVKGIITFVPGIK